ncbi:carotenoid ester lipase precursor [Mycena polygramma]|nr:carotenoid ester lipase precursor [Mycena polygramma]
MLTASLLSLSAYFSLSAAHGPVVTLDYGTFEGANDGSLTNFLGVPFARPPARFELPQPPTPLRGVYNATAFGPACPQQAMSDIGFTFPMPSHVSEDCLTLDVFRPKSAHPGSKLPVLVWLYGGGWQIGNSADTDMRPTVKHSIDLGEPVIIVTPNYRLNAFGFLAGKEASNAGITNLGLRDQIFALEWVQKHIHEFGGNPDHVVLGGFSAGSVSTALLQLSNRAESHTLFHGAFMASGSLWAAPSNAHGQQDYDDLVVANDCQGVLDTLDCLRHVPFEAFLSTVDKTPDMLSYRSLSLVWGPRVDGDIIVRIPSTSVVHGAFAKIPVLIGDVDDEGTLFALSSTNVTTEEEYEQYIRSVFLPGARPEHIRRLAELYPRDPALGSPFGTGSANQLTPEFKRIAAFVGDLAAVSRRRLFLNHASERQNTWSWLSKRGKSGTSLGAFHGSDIAMFFPPNATAATENPAVDFLINFINTLDPNRSAGSKPLNSVFWPTWSSACVEGTSSLLTFYDNEAIGVTADNFRSEANDYLIGLHLEGVTVPGPQTSYAINDDEGAQAYFRTEL